jgi:hypothetical protein
LPVRCEGNAANTLRQVPALTGLRQRLPVDGMRFNVDPPQTRPFCVPNRRFADLVMLVRKGLKGGHEKIERKFRRLLLHFKKLEKEPVVVQLKLSKA